MSKPTPKQVRHHYAKIAKMRHKLLHALHDAYCAEVIQYSKKEDDSNYEGHYVCNALEDMWQKFKRATDKQMVEAIRSEIMETVK